MIKKRGPTLDTILYSLYKTCYDLYGSFDLFSNAEMRKFGVSGTDGLISKMEKTAQSTYLKTENVAFG